MLSDRGKADDRGQERRNAGSPDSIELWSHIIGDLVSTPGVQQAGLLLHFYSGDAESEDFEPKRETVGVEQFAARLRDIREDELLMAAPA